MAQGLKKLRVAIVHDWLVGGGAELVVEEMHHMFPDAPIYTSYATAEWRKRLDDKVVTGWLQPLGFMRKFIPYLRIWWFTHLQFKDYNLVISSSSAEAKGIKVPAGTLHINYCYSPTHYYWSRYDEYLRQPGFGKFDWLARFGLKLLVGPLRKWDLKAAKRPDVMIGISTHIQQQIKKYYKRDAHVVHPPVDASRFKRKDDVPRHGFVIAGRQTPYKRFDLAVQACSELSVQLIVIGNGPDHKRLEKLAGRSVTFLTNVSDADLPGYFYSARGFIFPGLDDFGITPLQAMAAGTAVIAYQAGGALDYVVPRKTGEFFAKQTAESLKVILENFNPKRYNEETLEAKAAEFSPTVFIQKMQGIINNNLR